MKTLRLASAFLTFTLGGCFEGGGKPPEGADCPKVVDAGRDGASLSSVLSQAEAGTCVVLGDGPYIGSFEVPSGVGLVAGQGAEAIIEGDLHDGPAVDLAGGDGSMLWGIDVRGSEGLGVLVRGGPALIRDVSVSDAVDAALLAFCEGPTCRDEGRAIVVQNGNFENSNMGLWLAGVRAHIEGATITGNSSTSLVGGYGMVVSDGSEVVAAKAIVVQNQEVGVLVDGRGGTVTTLTDSIVSQNLGRGIWAQGLRGTLEAPALTIDGPETSIVENHLVGIGGHDAQGIIVVTGLVANTIAVETSTDILENAMIGDGVGLFEGSGDVRVDADVTLRANERAQMLVDNGGTSIIVVTGLVDPEGGEWGIVVQNTPTPPTLENTTAEGSAPELGVQAEAFPLPGTG